MELKTVIKSVIEAEPYTKQMLNKYLNMHNPAMPFFRDAKRYVKNPELIRKLELKYREDGSWCMDNGQARSILGEAREIAGKKDKKILDLVDRLGDDPKYARLKASLLYCVDGVDEIIGKQFSFLYKASHWVNLPGQRKSQKKPQDDNKKNKTIDEKIAEGEILSEEMEEFIRNVPEEYLKEQDLATKDFYDNEENGQEINEERKDEIKKENKKKANIDRFQKAMKKFADGETFKIFQKDKDKGHSILKKLVDEEVNPSLKSVYENILKQYNTYLSFEFPDVNPNFLDPETGEKGTLPSVHQRVAGYEALKYIKENRPELRSFGVYDGCGTGKTFIGVGLKGIVEEEMKKKYEQEMQKISGLTGENRKKIEKEMQEKGIRKPIGRTIVLCRINSFSAWEKGIGGEDHERYRVGKNDMIKINEQKKNNELFEDIKNKKWVLLNYEQLTTDITYKKDGKMTKATLCDALREIGFDYVVLDEAHNVRNRGDKTEGQGKDSYSYAVRKLTKDAYFRLLLTATPVFDNPRDYACLMNILRPDICPDVNEFVKDIEEHSGKTPVTARKLNFFIAENTIRRTEAEVNNLEDKLRLVHVCVDMTPEQKAIHNYLVTMRPADWVRQTRKALVDPRLVNPEILRKTGVDVSEISSAKYNKLIDMICGEYSEEIGDIEHGRSLVKKKDGMLEDKFVIFSSQFAEGVTREATKLSKTYRDSGYHSELEDLALGTAPLKELLEKEIRKKYGKNVYIRIIDGAESDESRKIVLRELSEKLPENPDEPYCAGVICTTKAGGESINLSAANHAFFIDEDYTPSVTEQAQGRELRKGQKKDNIYRYHIHANESIDSSIDEYIEEKRLILEIAHDGHELLPEEEVVLENIDTLSNIIIKNLRGGDSIDVTKAEIESLDYFEAKSYKKPRRGLSKRFIGNYKEPTEVQEIMKIISKDPHKCWKDELFAERYTNVLNLMSVIPIHQARICELVKYSNQGLINFPETVLSEGAGPSIHYEAYKGLKGLLKKDEIKVPNIVDRDLNKEMLVGKNKNRVLGNMNGRNSAIKDESFDMVDNASISLVYDAKELKDTLLEANRILKKDGVLSLSIQEYLFPETFYTAMKKMGFEVLTEPNQGIQLSDLARRDLEKKSGIKYTNSYHMKFMDARIMIAKKISNPVEDVDADDLWFKKEEHQEAKDILFGKEAENMPPEEGFHVDTENMIGSGVKKAKSAIEKISMSEAKEQGGKILKISNDGRVLSIDDIQN